MMRKKRRNVRMRPENDGHNRLFLSILCILSSIILMTGVLFALFRRPPSVPAEGTQSAMSNESGTQEPSGEFLTSSVDDPPQSPEESDPSDPSDSVTAFQETTITLMAVGDNLMHMGIVKTGKQEDGSYNFDFLFRNITDFLQYCDIKIINQETILGGNRLGFSGFPKFNSPTEVGDAIAAAGFNVVLHASNHAADQGLTGITNCLTFWDSYPELLAVGIRREASDDSLPLLSVGEKTFAVLNYTYGPNLEVVPKEIRGHLDLLCAMDETTGALDFTELNPKVLSDIARAKEAAVVVIVCPHWGTEYSTTPSSYQRKWAEQMTQAGADLILGTHPHVPQPVEWITSENGNTALCYYSLGNYVSTQKQTAAMLEGMAAVTFSVTEDGIRIDPEKTGVIPMVCHYTSGPVRLENVYLLEDYTEEQAAAHGIRSYGGVTLKLKDLRKKSEDIFGEMVMTKQAFLPQSPDQSQASSDQEANLIARRNKKGYTVEKLFQEVPMGKNSKHDEEAEEMTVELELDDGTKVNCAIITILTVEQKDYIVLLPLNDQGENEDGEVWFYGYQENPADPNEEPELIYIEDDEEYEKVADAFDEYLDTVEFDELVEDSEEE